MGLGGGDAAQGLPGGAGRGGPGGVGGGRSRGGGRRGLGGRCLAAVACAVGCRGGEGVGSGRRLGGGRRVGLRDGRRSRRRVGLLLRRGLRRRPGPGLPRRLRPARPDCDRLRRLPSGMADCGKIAVDPVYRCSNPGGRPSQRQGGHPCHTDQRTDPDPPDSHIIAFSFITYTDILPVLTYVVIKKLRGRLSFSLFCDQRQLCFSHLKDMA
ncbi:MAG: hypothetical protein JWN15_4027 [Firmicutes bacterium]|nr:hypothetical protein [Bacillota bacterium]